MPKICFDRASYRAMHIGGGCQSPQCRQWSSAAAARRSTPFLGAWMAASRQNGRIFRLTSQFCVAVRCIGSHRPVIYDDFLPSLNFAKLKPPHAAGYVTCVRGVCGAREESLPTHTGWRRRGLDKRNDLDLARNRSRIQVWRQSTFSNRHSIK